MSNVFTSYHLIPIMNELYSLLQRTHIIQAQIKKKLSMLNEIGHKRHRFVWSSKYNLSGRQFLERYCEKANCLLSKSTSAALMPEFRGFWQMDGTDWQKKSSVVDARRNDILWEIHMFTMHCCLE